jgi:amino acid permease
VIPRSVLKTLVLALPLLVCTFAVVLGVSALTQAMQDESGARTLRWISVGVLVLAVIDMLLLLGVLGLQALNDDDHHGSRDE